MIEQGGLSVEGLTLPGERFIRNEVFYPARITREQLEEQLRQSLTAFTDLRFDYDNVVVRGRAVTGIEAGAVTGTGEESEWVAVYGRKKSDLRIQVEFALDRYLRHIAPRSLFH